MLAARTGLMPLRPLEHPMSCVACEGQAQPLIAFLERADRIGVQVCEGDIHEPAVAEPLSKVHCATDAFGPTLQLLGAEFVRVVTVTAPTAYVLDQAAHRRQDLRRISVTP